MNVRGILRVLFDFLIGAPHVDPTTQISDSLNQMSRALDSDADATSYLMALADAKHEELGREVENVSIWEAQAQEMLAGPNPDEGAARRCIFLKQQATDRVALLTKEYEALQAQAENRAQSYAANLNEFEAKRDAAPTIRREAEFHQKRKGILQAARSGVGFKDAAGAFDAARQSVQIEGHQLSSRELLGANPNAAIDRKIRDRVVGNRIDAELAAMKQKAAGGTVLALPSPDASASEVLGQARALLTRPRFQAVLVERQLGNPK